MPRHQGPIGPVHDRLGRNLPTLAAGWVAALASAGTLLQAHNVKTFARTASGRYTITWDRQFSTATAAGLNQPGPAYCVNVSVMFAASGGLRIPRVTSQSGSFVNVGVYNAAAAFIDATHVYVTAFGTLR